MEAKTLILMRSDNHIRGYQIRIAAFLNISSVGTLIFHEPGKDFLHYICLYSWYFFCSITWTKKVQRKAGKRSIFHCASLPSLSSRAFCSVHRVDGC